MLSKDNPMGTRPKSCNGIAALAREEVGLAAAEKALLGVLALGLILLVVRIIMGGSSVASDNAKAMLEEQNGSAAVAWSEDQQGGGPRSGGPGSAGPSAGNSSGDNDGDGDSGGGGGGGGFWHRVASVSHVVLGVATLIPVVGTVAALADASIYELQGDHVNAAISVVAAIPIEGDFVELARGGEQLFVEGVEVYRSVNAEEKALQEERSLEELANTGNNTTQADKQVGTSGGERAGKSFTRKGKQQVIEENEAANGGSTTCVNCGSKTVPAKKSEAGVTPPANETQVDHIWPRSKGGDGAPSNGQVLCRTCNRQKGDKLPQ